MEYAPYITSIIAAAVAVLSFFRSGRKEQNELDKEQDARLSQVEARVGVHDERMNGMSERINRMELKQESHENKMDQNLKELRDMIDKMPMKIVELIKGLK